MCNEFLHFGCASFRESSFRKLSNAAKQIWSCFSRKTNKNMLKQTSPSSNIKVNKTNKNILKSNSPSANVKDTSLFSNDTIAQLVESVKFMSD